MRLANFIIEKCLIKALPGIQMMCITGNYQAEMYSLFDLKLAAEINSKWKYYHLKHTTYLPKYLSVKFDEDSIKNYNYKIQVK